jgi:hypothetical protein
MYDTQYRVDKERWLREFAPPMQDCSKDQLFNMIASQWALLQRYNRLIDNIHELAGWSCPVDRED